MIEVIYNFHRTLAFVKGIREVHEAKKEVFELWWNRTQHRPDKSYRCSVNWLVKAAVFEFNLFLSLDWYLCLTFLLLYSYARKASPTYEPYRR